MFNTEVGDVSAPMRWIYQDDQGRIRWLLHTVTGPSDFKPEQLENEPAFLKLRVDWHRASDGFTATDIVATATQSTSVDPQVDASGALHLVFDNRTRHIYPPGSWLEVQVSN